MMDTDEINNFVMKKKDKDHCLNSVMSNMLLKTINTPPTTVQGFANKDPIDLGEWRGLTDI